MLTSAQSQMAPLPKDLPFRIISKTIGMGAYASYVPPHAHEPKSLTTLR